LDVSNKNREFFFKFHKIFSYIIFVLSIFVWKAPFSSVFCYLGLVTTSFYLMIYIFRKNYLAMIFCWQLGTSEGHESIQIFFIVVINRAKTFQLLSDKAWDMLKKHYFSEYLWLLFISNLLWQQKLETEMFSTIFVCFGLYNLEFENNTNFVKLNGRHVKSMQILTFLLSIRQRS
jgi:hypothetical protein